MIELIWLIKKKIYISGLGYGNISVLKTSISKVKTFCMLEKVNNWELGESSFRFYWILHEEEVFFWKPPFWCILLRVSICGGKGPSSVNSPPRRGPSWGLVTYGFARATLIARTSIKDVQANSLIDPTDGLAMSSAIYKDWLSLFISLHTLTILFSRESSSKWYQRFQIDYLRIDHFFLYLLVTCSRGC